MLAGGLIFAKWWRCCEGQFSATVFYSPLQNTLYGTVIKVYKDLVTLLRHLRKYGLLGFLQGAVGVERLCESD